MPAPKFLTTHQAAELLRIAPEAVRRRIRNRRLLATRLPGSKGWLIPESALKQAVNRGSNHADTDQK